jgi:hypothetical protein
VSAVALRAEQGTPLGAIYAAIALTLCALIGLLGLDHLPFRVCVFKALTGHPCLTCGTTRALGRLYALDLRGAFLMNPLATALVLGVLVWGLLDALLMIEGKSVALRLSPPAGRVAFGLVMGLLLLNWAYLLSAGV